MVDKWDDMEVEVTNDPKNPPSPSWDVREIERLIKPGEKPDDPRSEPTIDMMNLRRTTAANGERH